MKLFKKLDINFSYNKYLFFLIYFFLRIFKRQLSSNSQQVWIIGENYGHCLRENGFHFYEFCRDKVNNLKVYFVIKNSCVLYKQIIAKDSNIVTYGSIRHAILYLKSTHCFYTHFYRDIIFRRLFQFDNTDKKIIYLHHGVLGFKRFDDLYMKYKNIMHLFTVGNEMEQSILIKQIGVEPFRIKCTGYARYDALSDNSAQKKQIVYIPTFRNYLLGNTDKFRHSKFLQLINSLISNQNLIGILNREQVNFKIYLHEEFQQYSNFLFPKSNYITIYKKDTTSINELISESRLLISDYSSVAWDFFYLGKPVLLYQFDIEEYLKNRGSYIDLNQNSIGQVVTEENELVNKIEQIISDNFKSYLGNKSYYSLKADIDHYNCQRIFNEVLKLS